MGTDDDPTPESTRPPQTAPKSVGQASDQSTDAPKASGDPESILGHSPDITLVASPADGPHAVSDAEHAIEGRTATDGSPNLRVLAPEKPVSPISVARLYEHDDGLISYTVGGERVRKVALSDVLPEHRQSVDDALRERADRVEKVAQEAAHAAWYEERQRQQRLRRVRRAGGRRRR